jgi:hypothetical protein
MGVIGGRGMRMTPFWEKKFEIDRENPQHRKKYLKLTENPGFLRKRPPFQILATPLTMP